MTTHVFSEADGVKIHCDAQNTLFGSPEPNLQQSAKAKPYDFPQGGRQPMSAEEVIYSVCDVPWNYLCCFRRQRSC